MAVKERTDIATDWYDMICRELDDLRDDTKACTEDEFEIPDGLFEHIKKQLGQIMESSSFPKNLPAPHVWLGPEGQIGLTWKIGKSSVDLIYGVKKFIARKTKARKQTAIDPSTIPSALAELAA